MTTAHNPLTDTAGGQDALRVALVKAVPAWIEVIRGLPALSRVVMRSQAEAALAEADLASVPGDLPVACPGDDASWETLGAFQALAKSLALDAYRPGGVTYLGLHWVAGEDDTPDLAGATTVDTASGLLCDPLDGRLICPDGGVCGHGCGSGPCWRTANAGPLGVAGWGEEWPPEVLAAEAKRGPHRGHL